MALALKVDSGRYPSLTRFLHELKRYAALPDNEAPDAGAIVDDTDEQTDLAMNAVRLMTIHAAKGLEAPIVWLIDADVTTSRADSHVPLCDWQPEDRAPRHFSFWSTKAFAGKRRNAILEAEAAVDARERLNLLYVAATRAKQLLIVSGTESSRSTEDASWLDRALAAADGGKLPIGTASAVVAKKDSESRVANAPSSARAIAVGARVAARARMSAEQRFGVLVHALLESPARKAKNADEVAAKALADNIRQAPGLTKFFDPAHFIAAYNEREIGLLREGHLAIERIDRLVEFSHEVWVLDYKTGQDVVNERNRAQVIGYCDALKSVYSTKPIHGALIDATAQLHVVC
jgi:ATP-dependent helicase/nuclease subunit A